MSFHEDARPPHAAEPLEIQCNSPLEAESKGSEPTSALIGDTAYHNEETAKQKSTGFVETRAPVKDQQPHPPYQNTVLLIIGTYSIGFVFAIIHCVFFVILDGKPIDDAYDLSQSEVSIISLLLVSIARSAIVATLGMCFTQILWRLLRDKALQVGLIEELFQIKANALSLANPKVVRHAPLLFAAAAISWLVPFATIYPPGALTISSDASFTTMLVNGSILNPSWENNFTFPGSLELRHSLALISGSQRTRASDATVARAEYF